MQVFLSMAFVSLNAFAQTDMQGHAAVAPADTLIFRIRQVFVDTLRGKVHSADVKPDLRYDFRNQYPYYRLRKQAWKLTDRYQLDFRKVPAKGWIHVFSVDGANDVRMHASISLQGRPRGAFLYPDSLKTFAFQAEGTDHLSLWYTPDSIPGLERLVRGIELTMGDFVKRNNRQIHTSLVLPAFGWQMLTDDFGFTTDPQIMKIQASAILPIVIEFEVKGKPGKVVKKPHLIKK